jgi:hypothetical protein
MRLLHYEELYEDPEPHIHTYAVACQTPVWFACFSSLEGAIASARSIEQNEPSRLELFRAKKMD